MGSALADASAHRDRLWPAFLAGVLAAFVATLVIVIRNPPGFLEPIVVCSVPSFVAAVVAIQFAPSRLLEVWGLLFGGAAVGVFLSILAHPTLGGGDRNLFPFEVLIFWVIALIPTWAGLLFGRLLRALTGTPAS